MSTAKPIKTMKAIVNTGPGRSRAPARYAEGVELMQSHQADVVKVVLEW